jgi:hypothetical protein
MQVEPTTHLLLLATTKHTKTNGTIYYKNGLTRIIWKGNHSNATNLHSNPIRNAQYTCKHKL